MAQIVYTITENTTTYGATSTENDEMIGGQGDDQFFGGYDTMWGDDGNDTFTIKNQGTVYGGTGGDTITVTNTNAAFASWLEGNSGSDSITAGAGNDTLFSGYGQNTLKGGNGNDNYVITFDDFFNNDGTVGAGADTITETSTGGVDTVYFIRDFAADGRDDDIGSDGKELTDPTLKSNDFYVTLANNVENGVLDDQTYIFTADTVSYFVAQMVGNSLNNNLKGSGLNDILDGAGGNDTINAGDGNDVVFVGNGVDTIDGGAGTDWVYSSVDFNLASSSVNIENIDLLDVATAITATGTSGNNTIIGNLYNNTLNGEAGNDTLDGATGIDTLVGGAGNDLYRIDSVDDAVDDAVVESATTQGTDTVEFKGDVATDTYTLTSGVENLKMLGNLKNAVGNALNNKIYGDSGVNNIKGDFGDDYLDGGTGLDSFEGGLWQ
ncbi:MAG: calcium-binding protein [Methylococcaceae bacterium]